MARAHGIDISQFQGTFDASKNTDDIQFVIIRASLGISADPQYENFLGKIASIPIRGAYHYYSGIREWDKQADTFLNLVTNKGFHFYALDVEPPSAEYYPDIAKNYLRKKLADGACRWLEYVADRTDKPTLLYTNKNIYEALQGLDADWMDKWPLWIANYRGVNSRNLEPYLPVGSPERKWKIWQYSADNPSNYKGKAYGVGSENIDLDVYNGTAQEMRQWLGIEVVDKIEDKMEPDKTIDKKTVPTWEMVRNIVKTVATENNAQWSDWFYEAGVNYNRKLRDEPYTGLVIDQWPIDAQFRAEIVKRLGLDTAVPDDEETPAAYTWKNVRSAAKAVAKENNAQWSDWFYEAEVNYDRKKRDEPYTGPAVDQWPIEARFRAEILERLRMDTTVIETAVPPAAMSMSISAMSVGEPTPAAYTWETVRNMAKAVAKENNAQWSDWFYEAGVHYDRKKRDEPYTGPPIDQWPIDARFRNEIIKRLGTSTVGEETAVSGIGETSAAYTWKIVREATKAVAKENNAQWSDWFFEAGVNYDRKKRDEPYTGPAIDQWPLDGQYRAKILQRLKQMASSGKGEPGNLAGTTETKTKSGRIKLNVPYISQQDRKVANLKIRDCGPTCLAMIINALEPDKQRTVDYFYNKYLPGSADRYATWVDLRRMSEGEGYSADFKLNNDRKEAKNTLKKFIHDGRPAIILVNYAALTQSNQQFAHFVVATGIADKSVFIHDPYLPATDETPGKFIKYPIAQLLDGWGSLKRLPPGKGRDNLNYYCLVLKDKVVSRLVD